MDIDAYLKRINYDGPRNLTIDTLRALHRGQLMTMPFENLDIHLGHPIVLDEARLFDKIVREHRGGFCYELNGLFGALLRDLGFDVTLLSARVSDGNDGFGPEFDHLVLLVHLDDDWLADVGFGASFHEPLVLTDGSEWAQGVSTYRLAHSGEHWTLLMGHDGTWEAQYVFTLQPRQFSDFSAMCDYHQSSPDSHFTRNRICTLNTPDGYITLTHDRLIVTQGGRREEHPLTSENDSAARLREHFGIVLNGEFPDNHSSEPPAHQL